MLTAAEIDDLREGFVGDALTDKADCPMCGSSSNRVDDAKNIHPDKPVTFELRACVACGHCWTSPFPSQRFLDHLYRSGSHSVIGEGWDLEQKVRFTVPEDMVRAATCRLVPGHYLEVGVGKGLLYSTYLQDGWQCQGVEPGEWGSSLPGVVSSMGDLPANASFDVVVALDVLEHVADPVGMLREIRPRMALEARIYLAFPNRDSLRFALQKGKWRMVRPIGHVHFFSKRSVVKMLSRSGLVTESIRTTDLLRIGDIRKPLTAAAYVAQELGWGDQFVVTARLE